MRLLFFLLLIAVAASVAGIMLPTPSINDQVDRVFQGGGLCEALRCESRTQKLRDFYLWNDTWWFWPEFYDGRISGIRDGFRRIDNCTYEVDNSNVAVCELRMSGLGLHYTWRVCVKDYKLDLSDQYHNPLWRLDAGTMEATVAGGTTRLYLEKKPGRRFFQATYVEVGQIEIRNVVFGNSTMTWNDKFVDTSAQEFQNRLREMLGFWLDYYIHFMNFLKGFNRAFVKAQRKMAKA